MSEKEVVYEALESGAWIRLNRPEAKNALNPAVIAGLREALAKAEADDGVRALVITGTGSAFCAGADLKSLKSLAGTDETSWADQFAAFLREVNAVFGMFESFPKPVVAAVNGVALAGGLELVLCCDLVVAAESALLGDAHANYGLLPGGGSSIRLPRKIGPTWTKYLLYTGASMPAAELVPLGLVNKVVPDAQLQEAVGALVATLGKKSPLGLRRMKQLVHDGLEQPVDAGLRMELLAGEVHAHSYDMQEGLAAFTEKREPVFRGC